MTRLEGRRALVTGAGQGIGRAIALAFAREGADVAVVDLQADAADQTAAEIAELGRLSKSIHADVGLRPDCDRLVSESGAALGGIDVLVNSAAWANVGVRTSEVDDELYCRTLDVCLSSVFWTMHAAYPFLKESGRASVINFVSNAGTEGMARNAIYAAAKEAIRGLSRSLAREWAKD